MPSVSWNMVGGWKAGIRGIFFSISRGFFVDINGGGLKVSQPNSSAEYWTDFFHQGHLSFNLRFYRPPVHASFSETDRGVVVQELLLKGIFNRPGPSFCLSLWLGRRVQPRSSTERESRIHMLPEECIVSKVKNMHISGKNRSKWISVICTIKTFFWVEWGRRGWEAFETCHGVIKLGDRMRPHLWETGIAAGNMIYEISSMSKGWIIDWSWISGMNCQGSWSFKAQIF